MSDKSRWVGILRRTPNRINHLNPWAFGLWQKGYSEAVWTDLAKFYHFGTTIKHFGPFESALLVFAKFASSFWQNCYAVGQIFIGVNSRILNKEFSHLVTLIRRQKDCGLRLGRTRSEKVDLERELQAGEGGRKKSRWNLLNFQFWSWLKGRGVGWHVRDKWTSACP